MLYHKGDLLVGFYFTPPPKTIDMLSIVWTHQNFLHVLISTEIKNIVNALVESCKLFQRTTTLEMMFVILRCVYTDPVHHMREICAIKLTVCFTPKNQGIINYVCSNIHCFIWCGVHLRITLTESHV